MRIALTGATGFLGSNIARHLHEQGHAVTALVRETSTRDHIEPFVDRFIVGDHADQSAWPALLDRADAVIHNSLDVQAFRENDMGTSLRSNLVGSIELLLASAPLPFVFISTVAVHHDMRPRWYHVIDEDHPLRPAGMYGAYKAAVEAHLWAQHHQHNRHAVAIRPSAVYGPDPTGKHLHTKPPFDTVQRGEPHTRPGGGKFVHVEDVARIVCASLTDERASGQPFNLIDCYARYADLALYAGEALGVDAQIDTSSPSSPENTFDCSAAKALVPEHPDFLARGHDGLRAHYRALAAGGEG
ncbi:MAG: SDR family oxidoreductase [Phycisphaerales bacterium]